MTFEQSPRNSTCYIHDARLVRFIISLFQFIDFQELNNPSYYYLVTNFFNPEALEKLVW